MQTQVAADDANIGTHYLVHFLDVLRDEHLLFVRHGAFVVPFRHAVVELVMVDDLQRMAGGCIGIDDSLDERVAGQAVAAMQSGTGAFADGIEALDAALPVEIDLDAAAHVVGAGSNRDVLLRDVDADGEALGVDVGEVMLGLLRVFMGDVEADVVEAVYLHLAVDSAGYDVAGSEGEPFVVLLHELLAVGQAENAAVAAHRLRDEVGRMRFLRVVEHSRMELHELHVLHLPLGAIDHGYAVAGSDVRVRRGGIDGSCASCRHECDLAQIGVHLARIGVEDVGSVALDVGGAAGDADAEVMLRDDLYGKVVLQYLDVGIAAYGFHESALYLGPCVVGMMEDAELGVSAFPVEVELAVLLLVEVDAPADEVANALRSVAHHLFHGCRVADVVARYHRVLDVLLEVIDQQVRHGGDAALSLGRIRLFERSLADERHLALTCICHLQRIAHAGHAAAYNQKFSLLYHNIYDVLFKFRKL